MVDWKRIDGTEIPSGEAIAPGAIAQEDAPVPSEDGPPIVSITTDTFSGNISIPITVPMGLINATMVVGLGMEHTTSSETDSEVDTATYAGSPLSTRVTEFIETGSENHNRTTILDIASPSPGTNTLAINFTSVTDFRAGTIVVWLLEACDQSGPNETGTFSNGTSATATVGIDTTKDNSISIEVNTNGSGSANWTPTAGQTAITTGVGDDGDGGGVANGADTGTGYEYHGTAGSYSQTWSYSGTAFRTAMVVAAYALDTTTQFYLSRNISYSLIRRLRM